MVYSDSVGPGSDALSSDGRDPRGPDCRDGSPQRRKQSANVPSESEEEEVGVPDADPLQDGSSAPTGADATIIQSVTKLTEIAAHLIAQKKQERSLDALLDGVGPGGGGESAAAQLPGSAPVAVSSRGWLELRSKVQNFATPVRFLWAV